MNPNINLQGLLRASVAPRNAGQIAGGLQSKVGGTPAAVSPSPQITRENLLRYVLARSGRQPTANRRTFTRATRPLG